MRVLLQILVLLLATISAFAASAYAQYFARTLVFGSQFPRSYVDMISCALAGAIAASIIVSFPISATFRKRAWLAAVAVSLPVLALRINEFVTYTGPLTSQVRVMAVVEACSYLTFLVLGSLFVSSLWPRPNNSFKPKPLRGSA
jgi:hypothetical protein